MATTTIQEIHVADAGLQFIVTVMNAAGIVDLSGASVLRMLFQKPDFSMLIVRPNLLTDGTDGVIMYSTLTTDLDQSGTWNQQVYFEIGPVQQWTNIVKFKVYPNLPLSQ